MQSIYLYKPPDTDNLTWDWIYYRVASTALDEPAGKPGAPIEICKVSWPTFQDIGKPTVTTGITGLESAIEHETVILKNIFGVEREKSTLIGLLP